MCSINLLTMGMAFPCITPQNDRWRIYLSDFQFKVSNKQMVQYSLLLLCKLDDLPCVMQWQRVYIALWQVNSELAFGVTAWLLLDKITRGQWERVICDCMLILLHVLQKMKQLLIWEGYQCIILLFCCNIRIKWYHWSFAILDAAMAPWPME